MKKHTYPTSIHAAANLMDLVKPWWFTTIDKRHLNMVMCTDCILGQTFGEYSIGMQQLFGDLELKQPVWRDEIFGMNAPKALWVAEIEKRLTNAEKPKKAKLQKHPGTLKVEVDAIKVTIGYHQAILTQAEAKKLVADLTKFIV